MVAQLLGRNRAASTAAARRRPAWMAIPCSERCGPGPGPHFLHISAQLLCSYFTLVANCRRWRSPPRLPEARAQRLHPAFCAALFLISPGTSLEGLHAEAHRSAATPYQNRSSVILIILFCFVLFYFILFSLISLFYFYSLFIYLFILPKTGRRRNGRSSRRRSRR